MPLQTIAIACGLILSYFLKDIQFLSLDFHFLSTGIIYPDFLLIFIVFFALYRKELAGIWVGFFGGLLEDGANWVFDKTHGGFTVVIGIHAFVYSLLGYVLGKLGVYFERYQSSFTVLLLLFTVIFARFFIWFIYGVVDNFNKNYPILGPAFFTALLAPLWFVLLGWVYRISK